MIHHLLQIAVHRPFQRPGPPLLLNDPPPPLLNPLLGPPFFAAAFFTAFLAAAFFVAAFLIPRMTAFLIAFLVTDLCAAFSAASSTALVAFFFADFHAMRRILSHYILTAIRHSKAVMAESANCFHMLLQLLPFVPSRRTPLFPQIRSTQLRFAAAGPQPASIQGMLCRPKKQLS
jgi:hypothetical protein